MHLADLPLRDRLLIRTYAWRTVRPVPCARLTKPLEAARVGLVTTAGLIAPGQAPFDLAARGGDVSYRVLTGDVRLDTLTVSHRSEAFDRTGVERDRNVVFPLDRLREMAEGGAIGSVAPRHLSFMGSITAPGRLRAETAPAAADVLVHDEVDVALLVPVWPFCHQTVSLVQSALEARGIVTVSLTVLPDITRRLQPPRALAVPFGLGDPLGAADDPQLQRQIVDAALALITRTDVPVLDEFRRV